MKKTIFAAALALLAAACETTTSRPYAPSTNNILQIQRVAGESKVQVADVILAEGVDGQPTCRLLGALDLSPGRPVEAYIAEAFRQELLLAEAYDVNSSTVLQAEVTQLEPNSIGTGSWKIAMRVSSNRSDGYSVTTDYSFASSYSAVSACQNVIDAFSPAMNNVFGQVVNHPEFPALIGAN